MQDQGAGVEADQDVLRAPVDSAHGLAADRGFEVSRDGPAQTAFAHDDVDDAPFL
jgi:hypothetical protein